jgi:hypothetical protein
VIYPHLLRHAFGDHVAQHAGLRVAQALMGHASVETTARVYTSQPGLEELANSVRLTHRDEQQPHNAPPDESILAEQQADVHKTVAPSGSSAPDAPVSQAELLQKIAELTTMVAALGADIVNGDHASPRAPVHEDQSSAPAHESTVAPSGPVSAAWTPLREGLERKGFTQKGLARALGVELQRVHKWVSGEAVPAPLHCLQIAQELDEPVIALWPDARNVNRVRRAQRPRASRTPTLDNDDQKGDA